MDKDDNPPEQKDETVQPASEKAGGPESAFDVWLHDRLHQLYDVVTQEPIPPELARLIEDDKRRRSK
jgi:hypothetical protein